MFSRSSDPWVAARTLGSLAGVREVGSLQLVLERGSIEICNELITIVVPKKGVRLLCKVRVCAAGGLQLLICRMRDECGGSVCSCHGGAVGGGLAGSGLPRVEDSCRQVQVQCSWSSSVLLGACVPLRLREPACGMAFTGAGLLSVEPGSSQDCSVLVSDVVVLPQGLSSACYGVLFEGLCCLVIWVVRSGEGSSQDRPLSFLVEVLPRSALCSFRATILLSLWFEVCRLVGLHSGEVRPGRLLALLVEVLPKATLDELSLLPVGLSMLQSAWAFPVKVWCPWLCVWLLHWPACLIVHFRVSRLRRWDFVCPHGSDGFFCFPVPGVLSQMVVW
ncbi:hypothetical protein Taro_036434 [Colocasia esculenta]|uniref:Uncharacterized protein n=1 Tax=Colocasia esculenta TaxID=4460 RepID=A0A843W9R9_COLES|nr:hypothetical protein [Colocasia esculenta]